MHAGKFKEDKLSDIFVQQRQATVQIACHIHKKTVFTKELIR